MANERGCASGGVAILGVLVSVAYLSNLTMGVIEIPDNLPLIGNLDEVFFSGVLFASLARLGINLPVGQRRIVVDKDDNKRLPGSGKGGHPDGDGQPSSPADN